MARYIDADKMVDQDNAYTTFPHDLAGRDHSDLVRWINAQPTADVAPRSEVEALENEIDRLKKILDYYALQYGTVKSHQQVIDRAKSEVARGIFGEVGAMAFTMYDDDSGELILCMYCEDFEELKQKYTEDQT